MEYIDLRSDTVTKPTEEMREAARNAEVGDDVWGDDPTVKQLEEYAAELLGMEHALFVTSGTQGNLVSILSHTKPGDEVIMDADAHIYHYEVGGLSAVAGVVPKLIATNDAVMFPEMLENVLRPKDIHFPPSSLLCLENTHNRHGGVAISPKDIQAVASYAHEKGLKIHMDGARLFNAVSYFETDVKDYTRNLDSVQICLSKGLSAPVGSIVAGSEEFIEVARKKRKMLGGGMRQAGVIAAPGLVALREMRERLAADHANAKALGNGLKKAGYEIIEPQTNILVAYSRGVFENEFEAVRYFAERKIGIAPFGKDRIRFTTHRHITKSTVREVLSRISD